MQLYQEQDICEEEMPEDSDGVRMVRTPTPPTLSPPAITLRSREEFTYEDSFPGEKGHLVVLLLCLVSGSDFLFHRITFKAKGCAVRSREQL